MLSTLVLSLLARPATAEVPAARANATIAGLQRYYFNSTMGTYLCCGQTGGAGGAGSNFSCSCERTDMSDCLNCYRWWAAQGLQVFIEAEKLGIIDEATVHGVAEKVLAHSPYEWRFGKTMPWAYIDDYAWYVLALLAVYDLSLIHI